MAGGYNSGRQQYCNWTRPPIILKTMVQNNAHQAELVEEHYHFPMRENQSLQERAGTSKQLMPLYVESINMLDGLADKEIEQYLEEHPKIVPLFEVDVAEVVTSYVTYQEEEFDEPDQEAIYELQ